MNSGFDLLLSSISCGLASICVVLSLWCFVRLSRLEAKTGLMETQLPHARVLELEQAFDALNSSMDAQVQKNAEWKQSVHNSVQRMDQIMRRTEEASTQLLNSDGSLNEDVVKGQLPAATVQQELIDVQGMSKQKALRLRYQAAHGGE